MMYRHVSDTRQEQCDLILLQQQRVQVTHIELYEVRKGMKKGEQSDWRPADTQEHHTKLSPTLLLKVTLHYHKPHVITKLHPVPHPHYLRFCVSHTHRFWESL